MIHNLYFNVITIVGDEWRMNSIATMSNDKNLERIPIGSDQCKHGDITTEPHNFWLKLKFHLVLKLWSENLIKIISNLPQFSEENSIHI